MKPNQEALGLDMERRATIRKERRVVRKRRRSIRTGDLVFGRLFMSVPPRMPL
jgi:hypothetical protein